MQAEASRSSHLHRRSSSNGCKVRKGIWMAVYISGGSNSVTKNGWVQGFRENLGSEESVINVSIGAAPSQMGAFRCLYTIDLQAGDTVIWEYGVNDTNHIDQRRYTAEEVLKGLEWIILHCRERSAKFAAVIFQPNNREKKGRVTRYRRMIHRICERYGVGYFDVPLAYLERHPGEKRIPERYFRGNAHYRSKPELMELIVSGAVELARKAQVPTGDPDGSLGQLTAYTEFDGGEPEIFENAMVSVRTWHPSEEGLICRLSKTGRIVGLIMTSTPNGGVFDVSIGEQIVRLSATYLEKKFDKTMVKFVSLPVLVGSEIRYEAGTPVSIAWAGSTEKMVADHRFKKKVGKDAWEAREARIVAVLTEE